MRQAAFQGSLAGRLILSAGLGGMGGAQPLAATMNGAVFLGVDVDRQRIEKRLQTGYLDRLCPNLEEALVVVREAQAKRQALSVAVVGNAADILPELVRLGVTPDIVTDQTSAHDTLNGYVPQKKTPDEDVVALRQLDPDEYVRWSVRSIAATFAQCDISSRASSSLRQRLVPRPKSE